MIGARVAIVGAASAALVAGAAAQPPSVGGSIEALKSPEFLLARHYPQVLVVRVESVEGGAPFTNAAPPRVHLVVERSMKGTAPSPMPVALWAGPDHDVDAAGAESAARRAEWLGTRVEAPVPGTRWIIAGNPTPDGLRASPVCRYPYSVALERRIAFALEHAGAWYDAAAREPAPAVARGQDRTLEERADLDALCAVSTDIVVATPVAEEADIGSWMLVVRDPEWLLQGEPTADQPRSVLAIDARFDGRRMVQLRARDAGGPRLLLFLRRSAHDAPPVPESRQGVQDPRTLVFADPVNGLLHATPERLDRIRAYVRSRPSPKPLPTPPRGFPDGTWP